MKKRLVADRYSELKSSVSVIDGGWTFGADHEKMNVLKTYFTISADVTVTLLQEYVKVDVLQQNQLFDFVILRNAPTASGKRTQIKVTKNSFYKVFGGKNGRNLKRKKRLQVNMCVPAGGQSTAL